MVFIQNETQYYDILKDKEEAVYFDDVDDLASKILFYRDNQDKAKLIAKNGHIKIHSTCNEKIVTKYMLDCLAGKKIKICHLNITGRLIYIDNLNLLIY